MKRYIIIISLLCAHLLVNAQNEGVSISSDNSAPDESAMLDVQSTTKGVLVPRLTTTQRTDIINPANGLLVFDSSTESFWFYSGSWIELISNASETDPVFTAHPANQITNAGSGQVITNSERTTLNSALQSESDPSFTAHPANNITNAGSGKVISETERDSLKISLQNLNNNITDNDVTISISNGTSTTFSRADNDNDDQNELQTLDLTGNTISISDGNSIDLSPAITQDFGLFYLSSNQSTQLTVDSPIRFDNVDGNLSLNGAGRVVLNANKTYKVEAHVFANGGMSYKIFNINTNTYIGVGGQSLAGADSPAGFSNAIYIIETTEETEIEVRISWVNGLSFIDTMSYLIIEEIK
jgi:hypothetical protein